MKKIWFTLLVVLNIVVYLRYVGPLSSPYAEGQEEENPALERLQLMSEAQAQSPGMTTFAAQPPPPASVAADIPHVSASSAGNRPAAALNCYRIGSFGDAEAARVAQEQVAGQMPSASILAIPEESVEGYWLLYPKARDLDAARHNRAMLQQKGVKDVWLIDKGEMQGAISLGLFNTREEAEAYRLKLLAQNVQSQIQVRMARHERYWVQFQWQGGQQKLDEALVELRIEHAQLPLDSIQPCH